MVSDLTQRDDSVGIDRVLHGEAVDNPLGGRQGLAEQVLVVNDWRARGCKDLEKAWGERQRGKARRVDK